jgi:hypothetical protein
MYSMYDDHISYLKMVDGIFVNASIILNGSSNKNNPSEEFSLNFNIEVYAQNMSYLSIKLHLVNPFIKI